MDHGERTVLSYIWGRVRVVGGKCVLCITMIDWWLVVGTYLSRSGPAAPAAPHLLSIHRAVWPTAEVTLSSPRTMTDTDDIFSKDTQILHGPCYLMETCFKQRLCRGYNDVVPRQDDLRVRICCPSSPSPPTSQRCSWTLCPQLL